MPRPRVKDEDRKRIAKACDPCKRRKEKCSGQTPCNLCRRRNREGECIYTIPRQRRYNESRGGSTSGSVPLPDVKEEPTVTNPDHDAEIAIESLLTLSGSRQTPRPLQTDAVNELSSTAHAPVPKLVRLLKDGHGKYIFVGDSSNLAFLSTIRKSVKSAIGECDLTTDPSRLSMVEALPSQSTEPLSGADQVRKPTRAEAEELVHSYFLATSGLIDLFDKTEILRSLTTWIQHDLQIATSSDTILYLVLAIGAANMNSDSRIAEVYFTKGRTLANTSFMDNPSVLTAQSYVLLVFYMLTVCRRNGAFMLLGIAVRAAHAIGLHRRDVNNLFEPRERKTRTRLWKTVRVLDLFMSASLGRPPATSTSESDLIIMTGEESTVQGSEAGSNHASAMLRICFIFERILNEVYSRREVDNQLVENISRQYRDWNMSFDDNNLEIDGISESDSASSQSLQRMIGQTHLKLSYYWSIILLTRPFLTHDVSSSISADSEGYAKGHSTSTMTEACIDAALRSIEIGSDLIHTPGCPKRPIIVTNSLFVAALVIGIAMFGGCDKAFPLSSSLEQARMVLGQLAKHDLSGRRYFAITTYLQRAASLYVQERDARELEKRRQGINSIFGGLLGPTEQAGNVHGSSGSTAVPSTAQTENIDPRIAQQTPNPISTQRTPPSGIMVNPAFDSYRFMNNQQLMMNELYQNTAQLSGLTGFEEEFPLFSLMNDYPQNEMYYGIP